MKPCVVCIFEFHTYESENLASVWLKLDGSDFLKTYIPDNFHTTFFQIGPLPWQTAEDVARNLRSLFVSVGADYVEHTTADD